MEQFHPPTLPVNQHKLFGDSLAWSDAWHTRLNKTGAEAPKTSILTLFKGGVLGIVLGSAWGVVGISRAIIGLNERGRKGVLAGMQLGYLYLTNTLSNKAHDDIQLKGGIITLVVSGLSFLAGGVVGLVANNQSIALFYFLRNFLSDDSVSQHENIDRPLPSLDLFDKENWTRKNAEGLVKQFNLASGVMVGFSLAVAAVYFALVITAFTARAVFYRGIYQGLGSLVMSPEEPTSTEELENFREYLIGNNLNEALDKDVLDNYRQDKKGFMSALWQDITRAFRLGTKSASEKTVQCVIEDVENKTVSNPSALYQAFQTLEATNLAWKDEKLTYEGDSDDLKYYFTKSNLTLDRLGVENGEAKKLEIARTLKKIGLFAKGSVPAGETSLSMDPAVSSARS